MRRRRRECCALIGWTSFVFVAAAFLLSDAERVLGGVGEEISGPIQKTDQASCNS
jgi:hypothetical protein